MSKVRKGSPLLILVLLAVIIFAVGAVIRYELIKQTGVSVTMIDNKYEIEIYTAGTGGAVITTIPFVGELIRDDPSQPTCTVETDGIFFRREGAATGDIYVSWWVSGLPDGASMTWEYGVDPVTQWVENTGVMLIEEGYPRSASGYISGIDELDDGYTGIVVTFTAGDGAPPVA